MSMDLMSANAVGLLARRLTSGLYVHAAALELMRDHRSLALAPADPASGDLRGLVLRKDGTAHAYAWMHHVQAGTTDPDLASELDRARCVSALVLLGDRLAAENYFDRAPLLEMVRHLRNGVCHGNRFHIRSPESLSDYPAHTRGAACRSPIGGMFEVPGLDGAPVLFDFMGPGDVLDVLISVGTHLLRQ